MLTNSGLAELQRSLKDESVLSVYIDGRTTDPAVRRGWRVQLDQRLRDLRVWLAESPRDERAQLERCLELLDETLAAMSGSIGADGWAAFITEKGVQYAEALSVPMPTMAIWSTGLCAAPYVRALKQHRPVIVGVTDAHRAVIYRYQAGLLDEVATVRARVTDEEPTHMGEAPRLGFHSGVRGSTGRDAEQRKQQQSTDVMLRDVAERLVRLANSDAWILLGGIPSVARHLFEMLPRPVVARTAQLASLDIHASPAEITEAARSGVSAIRNAYDAHQLDAILEDAGTGGRAVVSAAETHAALEQNAVRELYLSHHYLETHIPDAEEAVRSALRQGAAVEEVSGSAAEQLDRHGGIAARLRYPASALAPSVAEQVLAGSPLAPELTA